jgi:hypothetical protein
MPVEAKQSETLKISRWGKVQKVLDGLKGLDKFCREGVNAGKPGPCPSKEPGGKTSRKERRRQRKERQAAEQEAKAAKAEPVKVEEPAPTVQPAAVELPEATKSKLASVGSYITAKMKDSAGWVATQIAETPIVKQTFDKIAEGDKSGAAKAFGKEAAKTAMDFAAVQSIGWSTALWANMSREHGRPAAMVAGAAYSVLSFPASAIPLGRTALYYGIMGAASVLKNHGAKILDYVGQVPAGMAGFAETNKDESLDLVAVVGLIQSAAKAMSEKFGDKAPTWTDDEVAAAVLKVLGMDGDDLPGVEKQAEDPREFASTQFNLDAGTYTSEQGSPLPAIFSMAERIKESDLVEDGLEEEHHITIKFGLHADSPEEVRRVVAGFGPVKVRLGKTSIFPGDEHDVVKIDVGGDDLFRLNQLICNSLGCTDTHPEYKPHVTLAYVKPGLGEKYVGWDGAQGKTLGFSELVFSGKDRATTVISLVEDNGGASGDGPEPDTQFCREGRNAGKPGPCPGDNEKQKPGKKPKENHPAVVEAKSKQALADMQRSKEELDARDAQRENAEFRAKYDEKIKRIDEAYAQLKDPEAHKSVSLLESSSLRNQHFTPVKDKTEAVAFAKEKLGIEKLEIETDNMGIVNSVLGGLLTLKENSGDGMPTSLSISKSKEGADGSYRAGIGMLIGIGSGSLKIDAYNLEQTQKQIHEQAVRAKYPDVFEKGQPSIYSRRAGEEGYFSSTDPLAVIAHEYGHFRHFDSGLAKTRFEMALNAGLGVAGVVAPVAVAANAARLLYKGIKSWADWRSCRKGQAGKVSGYAMTSPSEFVAEVYAGTSTGKTYGKDTMDWFKHFGGKHP